MMWPGIYGTRKRSLDAGPGLLPDRDKSSPVTAAWTWDKPITEENE